MSKMFLRKQIMEEVYIHQKHGLEIVKGFIVWDLIQILLV